MAITLTQSAPLANGKLDVADVDSIITALTPVVTLPEGTSWDKVVALNLNVLPDGSAVLNVRFKQ